MQVFCTKVYFRIMSAIPFVFCTKYLQLNILHLVIQKKKKKIFLHLKIFYFKTNSVRIHNKQSVSFLVTILSFSTFSVVLFVHSSTLMKHQKGYTYMIDFTNTLFQSVKQKI